MKKQIIINLIELNLNKTFHTKLFKDFVLVDKLKADIYYENWATKSSMIFHVGKYGQSMVKSIEDKYKSYESHFFKPRVIIIKTQDMSDNVFDLNKELKEIINGN